MSDPSPQPKPPAALHSRWAAGCALILFYLAAAWLAVWGPRMPDATGTVPIGNEEVSTVPLLNAWTIGWNADRAAVFGDNYWGAPIFAPTRDAFALTEPQPHFLLAAPLTWASSPAVTYNLWLLVALVLNALLAWRLLRRCGLGWEAASLGGLLTLVLPYIHWNLGVLQLVSVWPILCCLERVLAYAAAPSLSRSCQIGVAGFVTYICCNYYGLFLAILVPWFAWALLGARLFRRSTLVHVAVGAGTALVLASPVLWTQWRVLNRPDYEREEELVQDLSGRPLHLLIPPQNRLQHWDDRVWRGRAPISEWRLGVGSLWLLTALAGAIAGLCRASHRRRTVAVLILAALSAGLACGLNVSIGAVKPFELLQDLVPGFSLIRSPYRFVVFAQLAVMVLAAEALDAVVTAANARPAKAPQQSPVVGRRLIALAGVTAWVGVIMWQVGPAVSELADVPDPAAHAGWITRLREIAHDGEPIACLPFPEGRTQDDYEQTARWMYLGLAHGQPLVNGYAGYFPETFVELKTKLVNFPDEQALRALADANVEICVVSSDFSARRLARQPLLQVVFRDPSTGVFLCRIDTPTVLPGGEAQSTGNAAPPVNR